MKINKIISGVFSLLILSSFIGCTEIEDHPDGRTDYSDLFTTNRKTYTYMNQCYGWILNYGMNYNYTMLAGCTDEAKDSWELQNGVTRKWNEGQLSPSAIRWRASKEIRKTTIIIIKGFVPATSFLPISLLPVSTRKIYVTVSRHRYLHYALSIIFNW